MGQKFHFSKMLLKSVLVLLPLISTSSSTTLEEEKELVGQEGVKKPKLFYVSTLSTTSTVSTLTVCYVTSATLTTCTAGKRRKRRVELDEPAETILPSAPDDHLWDKDMKEGALALEGGEEDEEKQEDSSLRKARFLVSWMTTTSVSTSLTYTTTLTVASLTCTPSSFALSSC